MLNGADGDGWYFCDKDAQLWLDSFETNEAGGTILSVTLSVQYDVEGGYGGNNSIMVSNVTEDSSGITPANEQNDYETNVDLTASPFLVDTWAEIAGLVMIA